VKDELFYQNQTERRTDIRGGLFTFGIVYVLIPNSLLNVNSKNSAVNKVNLLQVKLRL